MNRDKQRRRAVELFRDEFRAMSCRYLPIYHERFLSPLAVESTGWQAFADANRSRTSGWESWHFAQDIGWLGRFYGCPDGWKDFSDIMEHLLTVLSCAWSVGGAVADWMDIIYDLAETDGTALLNVERHVWNWQPEDHPCPEFGGVEDVDPYLQQWDERSFGEREFPKHPLHRVLTLNVFSASVVALETLLDPKSLFLWTAYDPDDLPVSLFVAAEDQVLATETESITEPIAMSAPLPVDKRAVVVDNTGESRPDYLFSKSGDTWELRFRSGDTIEKGTFWHVVGFAHLQQLVLGSPRIFPALELSPKPEAPSSRSAISENHALSELGDDESPGFNRDGTVQDSLLGDDTIRYLAGELVSLEQQIEHEVDPAEKKKLTKKLSEVKKQLNQRRRKIEGESKEGKAVRRVKKAIHEACQKLKKENMPLLADHLRSANVGRVIKNGFRYRPTPEIQWYSVSDPR